MSSKNISNSINFLKFIIFLLIIISTISYCPKKTPILIEGKCKLISCTKIQLVEGICKIDNEIIKTQWLSRFIQISVISSNYLNFVKTSKGDMLIETTYYPFSTSRFFFGITKNGRGYFKENEKETYLKNLTINISKSEEIKEIKQTILKNILQMLENQTHN